MPHKVCSLNCVYCEVGPTTNLSASRMEYVPIAEVLEELSSYLGTNPSLDYITFSGQGEPSFTSSNRLIYQSHKKRLNPKTQPLVVERCLRIVV